MEHQIIAVANQLIKNGKKPTVAMVKAKLTQRVPMPLLLKTLQKIESMTATQIAELSAEIPDAGPAEKINSNDELAALKHQVGELHTEVAELKKQLSEIKKLIGQQQQ